MSLSRRDAIRQVAWSVAGLGLGTSAVLRPRAADGLVESHGSPTSFSPVAASSLVLPDSEIVTAYDKAATQNVLAALDPAVFFGYWSVCADREGFGRGNTYPSLDGHQMSDALLWLGQVDAVKANWNYVRSFQKPNGRLPLAILPGSRQVYGRPVESNGGFYTHWVPGDPLRTLSSTTYIQNADIIFRLTQDQDWLRANLPSVNLAGEFLASLTTSEGLVKGGGYYLEMPSRLEFDGVAQCHTAEAFGRLAALNSVARNITSSRRYASLAARVTQAFRCRFWVDGHFAEYIHPKHGLIDRHGLTDTNWAALATGVADRQQTNRLWPQLRAEARFRYGGIPTAIATLPETYEDWEFTLPRFFSGPNPRHDVAAMGRVWYLEAWARARQGDGEGLTETLRLVSDLGRQNRYSWGERYYPPDGSSAGPSTYCEYPANLIRIVHRFLLGLNFRLDGSLVIAPTVPARYWDEGFGQTLRWRDRQLEFRCVRGLLRGTYAGPGPQRIRLRSGRGDTQVETALGAPPGRARVQDNFKVVELPPSPEPRKFEVRLPQSI
jgi:hypothetical protein